MSKYLDPKADLTFKKVFGEHKDLVISFLNALLPFESAEEEICEVIEYLDPELRPRSPLKKDSVVDLRCRDARNRQFVVEMQMMWTSEFKQRVLFNASKAYVSQLDIGQDYELLQPVYSLNLVNDTYTKGDKWYHDYRIVSVEETDEVIDGLRFVFIELPKFRPDSFGHKRMQILWLRYLTEINAKTRKVPDELMAVPEIHRAVDALEESAFTDQQLLVYDKFWDIVSTSRTLINGALRRGRREGMQKGLEKGMAKGLERGMKKGMEKGMEKERLKIADRMRQLGLSEEIISQAVGQPVVEYCSTSKI